VHGAVGWPDGAVLDSTALLSSATVNSAPTDYTTTETPTGTSRGYMMEVMCVG